MAAPTASETVSDRSWWESGTPFVWLTALAVASSICAVVGLVVLLAVKGLGHFWPSQVVEFEYSKGSGSQRVIGELVAQEVAEVHTDSSEVGMAERWLVRTGNKRVNAPDYRWVEANAVSNLRTPSDLVVLERTEWGNAYGRVIALYEEDFLVARNGEIWPELERRLAGARSIREGAGAIESEHMRNSIDLQVMNGEVMRVSFADMLRIWRPNDMSWFEKLFHYVASLARFLSEDPREANAEGGVFPAIFGTVMMVLLMSAVVTPLGVIAAVYLREYSRQGPLVRMTRIAVNNLAGVPSIIYGVFGLAFFVYLIGGTIDDLLFGEARSAPTFARPGLLWASLTLALLTLPVVIVATEEGLARIPKSIREGSFALGATKAETLYRVLLPIASPCILTGMILAVARAAGEVAPLLLVGVVQLVPSLPEDGALPYLHPEPQFTPLGVHIYDVGFQSTNSEAAQPLVYATALLLVLIIIVLNSTAILLRSKLERRFGAVREG